MLTSYSCFQWSSYCFQWSVFMPLCYSADETHMDWLSAELKYGQYNGSKPGSTGLIHSCMLSGTVIWSLFECNMQYTQISWVFLCCTVEYLSVFCSDVLVFVLVPWCIIHNIWICNFSVCMFSLSQDHWLHWFAVQWNTNAWTFYNFIVRSCW